MKKITCLLVAAATVSLAGYGFNVSQGSSDGNQYVSPLRIEITGEAEETDFLPGAYCDARPAIRNKGEIDIYCFFEVNMPVFDAEDVELEKTESLIDPVPLVRYSVEPSWRLIKETTDSGIRTEVYIYTDILKPGEETAPLFDGWQVPNFKVRDNRCGKYSFIEIAEKTAEMQIHGYAIQTSGAGTKPEDIWRMVK